MYFHESLCTDRILRFFFLQPARFHWSRRAGASLPHAELWSCCSREVAVAGELGAQCPRGWAPGKARSGLKKESRGAESDTKGDNCRISQRGET